MPRGKRSRHSERRAQAAFRRCERLAASLELQDLLSYLDGAAFNVLGTSWARFEAREIFAAYFGRPARRAVSRLAPGRAD